MESDQLCYNKSIEYRCVISFSSILLKDKRVRNIIQKDEAFIKKHINMTSMSKSSISRAWVDECFRFLFRGFVEYLSYTLI